MGLTHVTVSVRAFTDHGQAPYEALFLVETGATDSMASGSDLRNTGIEPVGKTAYELANGTVGEYSFGSARLE
jgi:hypothetical protein